MDRGEYLFAFKYNTRVSGWGIESHGQYATSAAVSHFVNDGWPKPWYKESEMSSVYPIEASYPWNAVRFELVEPQRPALPHVNLQYYMAQDPAGELGHGQGGSALSRIGALGGSWQLIAERKSDQLTVDVPIASKFE